MVLHHSKNKNKLKITALLTLHKCKPYFLSFICKRSQVQGHHRKHNPSCSTSRNEWQATWSSFLRTPVLICILNKFQIKNGTKINLLASNPISHLAWKVQPQSHEKRGKQGTACLPVGSVCPLPFRTQLSTA